MKKVLAAVVMTAVAGAIGSPADAARKRVVRHETHAYIEPQYWPLPANCEEKRGCVKVFPRAGERSIKVTIKDDAASAPYFYVFQDVDGDGISDTRYEHAANCGATEGYIPVKPHVAVAIFIGWAAPESCGVEMASSGTVDVRFSTKAVPLQGADG